MKKLILNLTILVACLMCSMSAVAAESYACYTPSNTTLTFYYDNQRSSRTGTTYDLNTGDALPDWYSDGSYADVTTVVFDASFSDAYPGSTHAWFKGMVNLTTITDIENLKTTWVTDMGQMFMDCQNLASIDVSHFNTANVTSMNAMFYDCYRITSLDVSRFNTVKVTNMSSMFDHCVRLTSLDVSRFKTDKVTKMGSMFSGCYVLPSLDLTSFNTEKVTDMILMFAYSNKLTTINVGRGWSTDNVTQSAMMFTNCTNLVGEQGTTYSSSHVDKAYAHIDGGTSNPGYLSTGTEAYACYSPTNTTLTLYYDKLRSTRSGTTYDLPSYVHSYSAPVWYTDNTCRSVTRVVFNSSFANARPDATLGWFANMEKLQMITGMKNYLNTSNVTNMMEMFAGCKSLTSLDVSNFNTAKVTDMESMFYGCSSLTSLDVSNFNTAEVMYMNAMFYGCSRLTSLDLSNFNTANVTNMRQMFENCTSLTSLDVSSFNTANVENMYGMFYNCQNLKSLDLSGFNTENVTNMNSMFYNCQNLKILDLSSFNTAKVYSMSYMFMHCRNLVTIYADDGWNTEAVTSSIDMFKKCYSIRGDLGTTYDEDHVDKAYAHLDGGTANPGYLSIKPIFTRGDVNDDGKVNITDVTALINLLLGSGTISNLAADCNQDGNVNIADVTVLINYLLSGTW